MVLTMLNDWFWSMCGWITTAAAKTEGLEGTEFLESSDTLRYVEVLVYDKTAELLFYNSIRRHLSYVLDIALSTKDRKVSQVQKSAEKSA